MRSCACCMESWRCIRACGVAQTLLRHGDDHSLVALAGVFVQLAFERALVSSRDTF
jgi:hypothetical protein